ncbi:hemolysin family protein [Aeromicrobium sp. 179-A 4D2 NHS]|uniref:hemolysin family protein n=1 Tax=Aeromicrobium sp. 179-A 4D2 NHS TaxID=3142375 RepID=UPI0039A0BFF9
MSNPIVVITVTVALIVLSAFFVAAEFALLAAKRHRLQDRAAESRSARAALRSFNELTVLLAGCQLGITACALGLGAVTKPAVKYALGPVLSGWGAPDWLADGAAFVLALVVVTFLHLVIGEMAPKSWAIAHPESAAIALALPMRGFMWLARPLLVALNEMANWCLRRVGVEPQSSVASGQTPDDLRHLVEHSANVGAIGAGHSTHLTEALVLQDLTLGDLLRPGRRITAVDAAGTVADVRAAAVSSGHLRILVTDAREVVGVVHVRDTLALSPADGLAGPMRPVVRLEAETPVYSALATMRETRTHLVLVTGPQGDGVLTLTDLLERLFPRTAA